MSIEKMDRGLFGGVEVNKISGEDIKLFLRTEIQKPESDRIFISVKQKSTKIEHQGLILDSVATKKEDSKEEILYNFTQGKEIIHIPLDDIEYIETMEKL